MLESLAGPPEKVNTSPTVSDEVKTTTCYMCACRCGIKVHLKDGGIRYIEGNKKHPVNKGVLCAKGSAGIMQHFSPARLTNPLRRTGPRGSGQFEEISWDEALKTATGWLSNIRNTDPKKLAFFTGRDQSQSLTGFWAQQFGTPRVQFHDTPDDVEPQTLARAGRATGAAFEQAIGPWQIIRQEKGTGTGRLE